MTYSGNRYEAVTTGNGAFISIQLRHAHASTVAFLQGDDASELMAQIEQSEKFEYPYGPFASFEQYLDYLLDAYDILGGR